MAVATFQTKQINASFSFTTMNSCPTSKFFSLSLQLNATFLLRYSFHSRVSLIKLRSRCIESATFARKGQIAAIFIRFKQNCLYHDCLNMCKELRIN